MKLGALIEQKFLLTRDMGPSAGSAWLPILIAIFSLWPTFYQLSRSWDADHGGSHGWLIGPVCLWLIWRAYHDFRRETYGPSTIGTVFLAGAVVGTLFLRLASVEVLEQIGAVVVVWLAAISVLAWRWGRRLAFPVGYFLFAVPVWEMLVPLLQRMTVSANSILIRLADVPAHVRGDYVDLPNGSFHIAHGCAGSHYFVVALALAALYGYLHFRAWRPRLLLIALMVTMAIVGNWIRVFMVIYAGYVTEMQHPWVVEGHYFLGWVIFALLLIPFFVVGRLLEKCDHVATPQPVDMLAVSPAQRVTATANLAATVLLLLAPPAVLHGLAATQPSTARLEAPLPTGGWDTSDAVGILSEGQPADWSRVAASIWHPTFAGATSEVQVTYASPAGSVDVYLNWYARQRQGAELIGYTAVPYGQGFELRAERRVQWAGRSWRLIEAEGGGYRRLVAVRYQVSGHPVVGNMQAKLWQGLGGLMGRTGGAAIVVSAACMPNCDASERLLAAFVADMDASLDATVAAVARGDSD